MRKYRNYTDDDIVNFSKEVKSIAGLLRKLDLKPIGGNYANIKRKLQKLNVDTSHWTGMGWNKDQKLKDWKNYSRGVYLKPHLIKERGHKCEECKNTHWLTEIISLEIHHIDGDKTNNSIENLQLLCPNCHSYTDNYRKPKFVKIEKKQIFKIPKLKIIKPKVPRKTKIVWPSNEELKKLLWEIPTTKLANQLGVSDKAIDNRCKRRSIEKPPRGYWNKVYSKNGADRGTSTPTLLLLRNGV